MRKGLQTFTPEYLERCRKLTPRQRLEFLENFRKLAHAARRARTKCKPISIKIEPELLELFRRKAELHGTPYQTQIKALMREWASR